MTLESFIAQWGYVGIFIGTMLEGEITMIIGGFLASQHILDIKQVFVIGTFGGFIGDQIFFYIGKFSNRFGFIKQLEKNVKYRKARRIVYKYGTYIILLSRYLVGMRMLLSLSLGVSNIPFRKFTLYNFISAIFWALTVGTAGYFAGRIIIAILGDFKKYEWALTAAIIAVAIVSYIIKKKIRKIEEKKIEGNSQN